MYITRTWYNTNTQSVLIFQRMAMVPVHWPKYPLPSHEIEAQNHMSFGSCELTLIFQPFLGLKYISCPRKLVDMFPN